MRLRRLSRPSFAPKFAHLAVLALSAITIVIIPTAAHLGEIQPTLNVVLGQNPNIDPSTAQAWPPFSSPLNRPSSPTQLRS